jgi:hypothetical protein
MTDRSFYLRGDIIASLKGSTIPPRHASGFDCDLSQLKLGCCKNSSHGRTVADKRHARVKFLLLLFPRSPRRQFACLTMFLIFLFFCIFIVLCAGSYA